MRRHTSLPLLILSLTAAAVCTPLPEPGRVPKVYNALITSSQNLAPSKSYPVYQPFYQDAFGNPFAPFYYDDHFKNFFSDPSLQPRIGSGSDSPASPDSPPAPASPLQPPSDTTAPPAPPSTNTAEAQDKSSSPTEDKQKQLPPQPSTQSPIPLNQFGLPPAILPLTPGKPGSAPTYSFDPFARFPYYQHYDPYLDPYNFQSYPLLPPAFTFGGSPPTELPPPVVSSSPPPTSTAGSVSPPPSDLDLINYAKKDPSIPDVPPPPVPSGGLKDDVDKKE